MGTLVTSPQPESYEKFLEAVRQRAEVDDGDFPAISRRLHQYTAADLVGKAKWHSCCYKDSVNSSKIERALKAYQRKLAASVVTAEKENLGCNGSTGPTHGFFKFQIFNGRTAQETAELRRRAKFGRKVKTRPRYGDFSIFKDGGRRHLGFFKCQIFNGRTAEEDRTASPCQI